MKLTMNRKGEFQCVWADQTNKCGTSPGSVMNYTYHCQIETGDILDRQGFVVDQLRIDEYFKKKYSKTPNAVSCETIALNAVKDVKRMIENHMMSHSGMSVIYRIAVTIAVTIGLDGNDSAMMTAEWVPETTKPIANVKKAKPGSWDDILNRTRNR